MQSAGVWCLSPLGPSCVRGKWLLCTYGGRVPVEALHGHSHPSCWPQGSHAPHPTLVTPTPGGPAFLAAVFLPSPPRGLLNSLPTGADRTPLHWLPLCTESFQIAPLFCGMSSMVWDPCAFILSLSLWDPCQVYVCGYTAGGQWLHRRCTAQLQELRALGSRCENDSP